MGLPDYSNSTDSTIIIMNVYGDSSESAYTSDVNDVITTSSEDGTATENVIVGIEILEGIEGCVGGETVLAQRQGDQVCFSFQKEEFDGDNSVYSCGEECIPIGRSGSFETYIKSDSGSVGGVFGIPFQSYAFGEKQVCRIRVDFEAGPDRSMPAAGESLSAGPFQSPILINIVSALVLVGFLAGCLN
mmetsp:Transcript_41303/g.86695  ORF Transcript_41303/g.86695 Transcript_41303/m.86695 type:complete len:188 (-) Transcript_41303:359-922(-)